MPVATSARNPAHRPEGTKSPDSDPASDSSWNSFKSCSSQSLAVSGSPLQPLSVRLCLHSWPRRWAAVSASPWHDSLARQAAGYQLLYFSPPIISVRVSHFRLGPARALSARRRLRLDHLTISAVCQYCYLSFGFPGFSMTSVKVIGNTDGLYGPFHYSLGKPMCRNACWAFRLRPKLQS